MLLLIDDFDGFTRTLVQDPGETRADVAARCKDAPGVPAAMALGPAGIVLSPGSCIGPDMPGAAMGAGAPLPGDIRARGRGAA